jgi:hypothetical protein
MATDGELEVIARNYDMLLWVIPGIGKIPRSHRFTLGEKIELMLYGGLDDLIRAKFAARSDRLRILRELNVRLERMRMFWRLARDLRVLSREKYERAVRDLHTVGDCPRPGGSW